MESGLPLGTPYVGQTEQRQTDTAHAVQENIKGLLIIKKTHGVEWIYRRLPLKTAIIDHEV